MQTPAGWYEKPPSNNRRFTKRTGERLLGEQGGYMAEGIYDLPDTSMAGWVETDGPYGYD